MIGTLFECMAIVWCYHLHRDKHRIVADHRRAWWPYECRRCGRQGFRHVRSIR